MNWGYWENWVENWCNWELVFMDGLSKFNCWGNWQVGSLDTEAKTISNVVDSLDETVGIGVAVRSSYSTIGVSGFLLGRVDVGITVSEVSEFILRLELAGLGKGWSSNQSGGGYKGWGKSSSIWESSIWGESTIRVTSISKSGNSGI